MSSPPKTFTGWVANSPRGAEGELTWTEFKPKTWEESDVDIKITHSGICGSDLHVLRSGWGPTDYPCVVGHEIVGEAVRVGDKVKGIKVGDRVGVGPFSNACWNETDKKCKECAEGQDQYCKIAHTDTYNGKYPNGEKSYGGYASHARVPGRWVFKIPEKIPSELAAPMLCAGVTTYRPLKRMGCGPGKKVGIIGLGGLGHFGILWAKAMGADEVVAISRSRSKEKDAKELGADRLIATSEDGWEKKNANTLDLILCTASNANMPFPGYLNLLTANGHLTVLGAPDDQLPSLPAFAFIRNGITVGGSMVGSYGETKEMLEYAAEKGLKPWVNVRPMSEAREAVVDFVAGKPRYRYVLKQDKE